MSSSRELANYCQESVKSFQSKKISDALNNFHLKTCIDFVTKSIADEEQSFFELNKMYFDIKIGPEDKQIYNKVIDYMETYLIQYKL